ncbi:NADH-quinone oxidoreductase subunit NuoE [Plantactinospora siamensis]|uniref:NADH-quinone oxidoreductase subunit NuoE n=1 Tax=Plantactinospora siamensis TaxID=555372 RepID=A0ABV6NXV6_9ACTN
MTDIRQDEPVTAAVLRDRLGERAREIVARYPADRSRSALLPLLHLVQAEEGYVSPSGVQFCAEVLGLNKAQVGAVATFYTMYKRRPTGDWLVSVCTNTMCNVLGGQEVYDSLSELLGVGHDETTPDGTITLEHAECLAACDYGPVMTVNYEFFDRVDRDSAASVVEELRSGGRPTPTRGARLCTLKEMAVQLAGFADPRDGAVADGRVGDASLRGLRLAQEHGVSVPGFDPDTPIRSKADADKAAERAKAEQAKADKAKAEQAEKAAPAGPPPVPADAKAAEAAGAAGNQPAGDAKPAGEGTGAQERNLAEAGGSTAAGAGAGGTPAGSAGSTPDGGEKEADK